MRVCLLSLEIQRGCAGKQAASILGKVMRFGAAVTPESQTLIVPEKPPETIVLPSGENCTDMMAVGSAFSTLETSLRLSANG